jgi:succinyl-CoA synthetase beta subunit
VNCPYGKTHGILRLVESIHQIIEAYRRQENLLKLHEYQSKRIFAQHGIPIPRGDVAATPAAARRVAEELASAVVVKAQVLVGGRGKAGGIKLAHNAEEAEAAARQILGMTIKGLRVDTVLIDQAADIRSEIYLGITLDRARRTPVVIASSQGGMEIEEVARSTPDKIVRVAADPLFGLLDYQARDLAFELGLQRRALRQFTAIAQALYRVFVQNDATLAEINPLASLGDEQLLAVDGKIVLDDNSLFRHKELSELRDAQEETDSEREARLAGISYVKLDGEIGCMVNGAGLAMATMDIIGLYGGQPANFLDIGGGAKADKVASALRIILSDPNVKAVLLNIFGGITRCDEVARGVLEALSRLHSSVPMVARLVGTNEDEGRAILAAADLATASSLAEAAQTAVALAHG